jgi:four helix bundle protein
MKAMKELSVIQKCYDLVKWYVPIIERFPRVHKFTIGDRVINQLYSILENLIRAKFAKSKLAKLEYINTELAVLRHQTRLLLDFKLIDLKRYEYVSQLIDELGGELGNWIKTQREREAKPD